VTGADTTERRLRALCALTIFCGAFLLFLVQPIIAKELLPWFGGAANVWATCLAFFQLGLLVGYVFADALVHRLARVRHVLMPALLLIGALTLPIVPATHWKPDGTENPSLWVLGALATTVGLPYVLVGATGPLVQSWYAQRCPGRSPYRLFALSNLASMLALLVYPALLEPLLGTRRQAYLWSAAYLLWAALILGTARLARPGQAAPAAAHSAPVADSGSPPHLRQYLMWAGLASVASFLLVAVTNHLTRDVAAIPLLWIVPLAVYLLTFIVSFQSPKWLSAPVLIAAAAAALVLYAADVIYLQRPADLRVEVPISAVVALFCVVLGGVCLFCHGSLALTRPAPQYLTRFYLTIALGGALGSILIGLAAPALLHVDFDLEIAMSAAAFALFLSALRPRALGVFGFVLCVAMLGAAALVVRHFYEFTVLVDRNFYAALRVYEWNAGRLGRGRSLTNGIILHGTQYSAPDARRRPTDYYAEESGVGRAIAALHWDGQPRRIGVIGLGTGTLAAYGRHGDVIRFYELNPQVIRIAHHEFTYLADSAARIEIALGDARLSLEREPPQHFDLLVIDAFSSDAIPVHLVTVEALDAYLRHMAPEGVIAFHTTNRYVDLPPVIERLAQARKLLARIVTADDEDRFNKPSTWVLVSRSTRYLAARELAEVAEPLPQGNARVWTDDFSNLLGALR
jgi:hypothetical protein